jgi:hypothetical protein
VRGRIRGAHRRRAGRGAAPVQQLRFLCRDGDELDRRLRQRKHHAGRGRWSERGAQLRPVRIDESRFEPVVARKLHSVAVADTIAHHDVAVAEFDAVDIAESDALAHAHPVFDRHPGSVVADTVADVDCDSDPDPYAVPYAVTHSDVDIYADGHADPHGNSDGVSDRDSRPHCHADSERVSDSETMNSRDGLGLAVFVSGSREDRRVHCCTAVPLRVITTIFTIPARLLGVRR